MSRETGNKFGLLKAARWHRFEVVFLLSVCMHIVFNIHVVVFRFSTMRFRKCFEHITYLWFKMDSSDNV